MSSAATPSPAINASLSHSEVRSVVTGLMLAILLGALDQTIVSVSLPMMSADLQGVGLLAWVVSGYLIAVAVATPIYGKLGDLYGRRVVLSSAIGIFLLASVACAMAPSMPFLVGARIVQGLGGGGLISVAQATIADVVAPRDRGRYQAYISGAFAVASVSGPLAGGLLTAYLSWRWIFWINVPLGLGALLISRRALARLPTPHIKRPVDYLGATLLTACLTSLLIGITRAGQGAPWLDERNLWLFGVSLLSLIAFIWQEQRTEEPIVPLRLFRIKTVSISCAVLFVAFIQVVSLSVLIPLELQMMTTVGADGAAVRLIPLSMSIPLGAYIGGKLMSRTGRFKNIQLVGAFLMPLGVLVLAVSHPQSTWLYAIGMMMTGAGVGLQIPTSTVAVQNAVPHRHVGIATAVAAFSRSLGAAIGIAVLMALLLTSLQTDLPASVGGLSGAEIIRTLVGETGMHIDAMLRQQLASSSQDAFQKIFLIGALIACASFILTLCMKDESLDEKAPEIK
jgi:EmrB/QacA subfamily drug resistance transporter